MNIVFVCMGNICRSPSAQGVFEKHLKNNNIQDFYNIDSAGTHSYHIGASPDPRSVAAAKHVGIDISQQKARKISTEDFENFDYIIVMDNSNHMNIKMLCPKKYQYKILKMMGFLPNSEFSEVPDPYYGSSNGFKIVLELLEKASCNLYAFLEKQRQK
ncbi:MAG: low molecular weight protein-tyrosine-phosphatase [Marinicellaceae bacterium]